MLYLATITRWVSHRDSCNRVAPLDGSDGRQFLINTDRIKEMTVYGTGARFKYFELSEDPREAFDLIETTDSVAELIVAGDDTLVSNVVTLPIFRKNDPTKATKDTTINVDQFIYADAYNPNNDYSWVVYEEDTFKRVEVLVNLTLAELLELVYGVDGAPTDLDYTVSSGDLTWTNGSTNEDGISIERSTDGVTYAEIATVGAGVATYSDDPTTLVDYYYRVRAYRGTDYSDYSNVVHVTADELLTALFDFYYIGGLTGDNLTDTTSNGYDIAITGKDFVTAYIPATSASTFQAPDNATLKADDTDYLWFDRNGVVRNVEVSELIGYDFTRTVVKYDNSTPYHIRFIGILKSGITLSEAQLDKLYADFELSQYWSGVLDVRGVVKGNRGLSQSVWPTISTAALDYTDTYVKAVEADGGEIISLKTVQSEYQRLIDTGNILTCWYSYHWQCGVKKSLVDYGLGDVDMVSKWYNLSPVAGRFAQSVVPYSIVAGTDARPEYTASGLLFRPTNLDGGTRCGLETTASSVLPNVNNTIRQRAIVIPVGAAIINTKGYQTDEGYFTLLDVATTRQLGINYRVAGANKVLKSTENDVFANGVEVEVEVTALFTGAKTVTWKKNGTALTAGGFGADTPIYPALSYPDCVGCSRSLGRTPYNGYIKQIELFYL